MISFLQNIVKYNNSTFCYINLLEGDKTERTLATFILFTEKKKNRDKVEIYTML